jgi:DNA polymerase I
MKRLAPAATQFIDTETGVIEFEHRLSRSKVMFIGFDTEYDPGVAFHDKKDTEDVRKRRPILLSMCVITAGRGSGRDGLTAEGYVFDIRKLDVRRRLKFLCRLTAKLVGHFLETDLITLLSFDVIFSGSTFYDTFLAEKFLELGSGHPNLTRELDRIEGETDDPEEAEILCSDYEKEYFNRRYALENLATRYGVGHRYVSSKQRLQQSFIGLPDNAPITAEQIDYALEDAYVACNIYLAQSERLLGCGMQTNLEQVTFPLIPHLAQCQWNGACVAVSKLNAVHARVRDHAKNKREYMKSQYGLENFRSHTQRKKVLISLDIAYLATGRSGKLSLSKSKVKELVGHHDYFKDHLQMSHFESTQSSIEKILDLIDDNGFIHPRFHQLQAKTGRITTTRPSPFDKLLRPIVVPSRQGFGIFEMDVGQAEVWLIACMADDKALQRACESYDIYLRLGVEIVRSQFDAEDADLISAGGESEVERHRLKYLKNEKYARLRSKLLKPLILAILYGQTARTVAKKTEHRLSFIHDIFSKLEMAYPDLFRYIEQNIKYGSARGYIELRGGFRIHVSGADNEVNRLRNNPVQGMCAVLFNRALFHAFEAAPRFGARILFPLYDAIVVEAPIEKLLACSQAMREIFTNVFQSAFPDAAATVKLDVNDVDPSCWNNDGHADSLLDVPVRRPKEIKPDGAKT